MGRLGNKEDGVHFGPGCRISFTSATTSSAEKHSPLRHGGAPILRVKLRGIGYLRTSCLPVGNTVLGKDKWQRGNCSALLCSLFLSIPAGVKEERRGGSGQE